MLVIRVVGYPRSGNVWLSRLLAATLEGTVYGPTLMQRQALGGDVVGYDDVAIVQGHAFWDGQAARAANDGALLPWSPRQNVALVLRDPRDVAVSCRHYFGWRTIGDAVTKIGHAGGLFYPGFPSWQDYNAGWLALTCRHVVHPLRYEDLLADPAAAVALLLQHYAVEFNPDLLARAIEKHAFAAQRERVRAGLEMPFGPAAQLQHLRHGTTGDWREEFTRRATQLAQQLWGDWLKKYWEE
jgi:hypothetical protein